MFCCLRFCISGHILSVSDINPCNCRGYTSGDNVLTISSVTSGNSSSSSTAGLGGTSPTVNPSTGKDPTIRRLTNLFLLIVHNSLFLSLLLRALFPFPSALCIFLLVALLLHIIPYPARTDHKRGGDGG